MRLSLSILLGGSYLLTTLLCAQNSAPATTPSAMERFSGHWNQIVKSVQAEQITLQLLESNGLPEDFSFLEVNFLLGPEQAFWLGADWGQPSR